MKPVAKRISALGASAATATAAILLLTGCKSTGEIHIGGEGLRTYPYDAPILGVADVQVFRDGPMIQLVNHTSRSFGEFDLWVNERFQGHATGLPAGGSLTLDLSDFVDEYGERFRAGGLFSAFRPDPVAKAEIQTADGLVGLVAIPERRK